MAKHHGCIECGSTEAGLERGDDGHFRRSCSECGHESGPYVSEQIRGRGGPEKAAQTGLDQWT